MTPDLFNEAGAIGILRGAGVFQYCTNLKETPTTKMSAEK